MWQLVILIAVVGWVAGKMTSAAQERSAEE